MHHAHSVGIGECPRELLPEHQHALIGHPAIGLQQRVQRLTVDEFHRDICNPLLFAHFVNGRDIGMAKRARGARFAQEADIEAGIASIFGFEYLDGDLATDARIDRAIDVGHRAFAQATFDAVASQRFHPTTSS